MAKLVALLRAVNVGGRKIVMSELRAMCADLGFADAKTLLASGNLVLDAGRKTPAAIEALLEQETAARFKIKVEYMVRTGAEWAKIVAANPFPAMAKQDPSHLVVFVCKDKPSAAAVKAYQAALDRRPEECVAKGRELYVTFPDGIGTSPVSHAKELRKLVTPLTGRNWNTALKLAALVDA